ncbi:ribosomal protein L7/L12 [Nocardioides zeae]|uniref:Ribosomal protein L7/L12 n=1 Tax=Nocardioides zeae TaxID=1457234 RepID=A0ACC6ICS5_9ACTN|nr:ribosomal protein L7/L12 [Nocardioides zeae]MDR6208465.1 ribosomal protein L7/L12 [Nocardioides zeae]
MDGMSTSRSDRSEQPREQGGLRGWWRRVTRPWPEAVFTEIGTRAVVLDAVGEQPVAVIREVRRVTGWDLARATHAVEAAPPQPPAGSTTQGVVLVAGLSATSAAAACEALARAGATARVADGW